MIFVRKLKMPWTTNLAPTKRLPKCLASMNLIFTNYIANDVKPAIFHLCHMVVAPLKLDDVGLSVLKN